MSEIDKIVNDFEITSEFEKHTDNNPTDNNRPIDHRFETQDDELNDIIAEEKAKSSRSKSDSDSNINARLPIDDQ